MVVQYPDIITGTIYELENVKGTLQPKGAGTPVSFKGRLRPVTPEFKRTASGDLASVTHTINFQTISTELPKGMTLEIGTKKYKLLEPRIGQIASKLWVASI